MSIFRKIFGGASSEEENQEDKSPFMPEGIDIPVDELFISKFVKNGGKFLYCENIDEVKNQFENILEENDWFEKNVLCFEPALHTFLDENRLPYNNVINTSAFLFASCENLIANEGSILFSSKQIKHYKPNELPVNIVIFATTSQLVPNKSESLRKINRKYKPELPNNITALSYFEKAKSESFMQYGSVPKNLYLLLLEDL